MTITIEELYRVMLKIQKDVDDMKDEMKKGRSHQFPDAVKFIIDNNVVIRGELAGKFQSMRSGYYMDKFKEYARERGIEFIRFPSRGHPELFIHIYSDELIIKKFIELWNTEGQSKKGIQRNGNFTIEEWRILKTFINTNIKPNFPKIRLDDLMVSWK